MHDKKNNGNDRHSKKIEKKLNAKRVQKIKKFERAFSAHKYTGKGKSQIEFLKGKSVIALAAPHSVNFFDVEDKLAESFSGGLTKLLAGETGCHSICVRKKYIERQRQSLVDEIGNYISSNQIKLVIDLQLVSESEGNESIIYIKSGDESNDKFGFISRAIKYSFEFLFRDEENINSIVMDNYVRDKSIIGEGAENNSIAYVFLGINEKYVNPINKIAFIKLYKALLETISMLANLDWNAEKIKVYKLWQSGAHKPQDKIEISYSDSSVDFDDESLLNICTYGFELEKVRLHKPKQKTITELQNNIGESTQKNEYVFLTNRLIEILFGREWIEGKEDRPGLREAPIVVYSNKKESYPIGLPKANQIDGVFFTSTLYEEKIKESEQFDYVIFNRFSDSRLYVEFDKLNYLDYGRVKDENGISTKKVMIPRYYKRLLGYLDYPLKLIRKEEYDGIIKHLDNQEERDAFEKCYEKIDGEIFYRAKKIYISNDDGEAEADNNPETKKIKDLVINVQNRIGVFNNVEILRVPKEVKQKEKICIKLKRGIDKLKIRILKKAIGKSEYLLKTEWTSETDDRNNIARLSSNMMSLLGVSEDDKILVRCGKKQEILRVLANDDLTDYQIGIPASARKKLGMNSVNDIVIVHRDMVHIFWRHSEEQTIAILGTVLAVFQVISQIWVGVLLCLIVTPLIMYFVLNEERVKVK